MISTRSKAGWLVAVSLLVSMLVSMSPSSAVAAGQPIIGHGSNCLDIPGQNTTNGTNLQMWDCNGTVAQQWTYSYATGRIMAMGKCLDVEGPASGNGVNVQIWSCQNVPQHRWSVTALGQIKSYDGRCLDVRGWGTSNGTAVQLWSCVSPVISAQKWQVDPADRTKDCSNDGAYLQSIRLDYATKGGVRGLVYRITPTEDGKRTAWRSWNHDNLWDEFVSCLDANYGMRLARDDDGLDTGYLYDQVICHAVAEQIPVVRGQIGPTWDIEVDNAPTLDYCNDLWPG